jgi:hypothetical protein
MGLEITVVDDSDYVGYAASATREGEIYMANVQSMVDHVIARLWPYSRTCSPGQRPNKISRLNVLDHGNPDGLEIGADWITVSTLPTFEGELRRLREHFEKDGFVHLQHCHVGNNRALLTSLARVFGVRVFAGTGYHNPVYRCNFGDYVRAEPNGQFFSDVARP